MVLILAEVGILIFKCVVLLVLGGWWVGWASMVVNFSIIELGSLVFVSGGGWVGWLFDGAGWLIFCCLAFKFGGGLVGWVVVGFGGVGLISGSVFLLVGGWRG